MSNGRVRQIAVGSEKELEEGSDKEGEGNVRVRMKG